MINQWKRKPSGKYCFLLFRNCSIIGNANKRILPFKKKDMIDKKFVYSCPQNAGQFLSGYKNGGLSKKAQPHGLS
jgi:hypothetical protein